MGDLGASLTRQTMGLLQQLLPLISLAVLCHGAAIPEAGSLDIESLLDTFQNIQATINNKGQVSTVTGTITASGNDKTVHIEANHKGQLYVGEVSLQQVRNKPTKVSVDVKR